jgi:hypothetical protein
MQVKGDVKIVAVLRKVKTNTADNDSAIPDLEQEACDELLAVGECELEIESADIIPNTVEITGYDDPPDREDL